ncbi:MAG TPA: alpha/beta fold hydrolase [Acidimicrobiales bacterium]|nr:alpha/beta fold hydrolase [Acidimicrobiales bacterium]
MFRRALVALAVVAVVASGCSGGDGDDAGSDPTSTTVAPSSSTVPEDPELAEAECWWSEAELAEMPEDVTVTCGTLEVPADRTDAEGGVVTLAVARLHHAEADAGAEPVVYLHGGPGGDALVSPPLGLAGNDALAERDIITFDQRGVGRSLPSLDCPEKEEAILDALASTDDFATEHEVNRAAVRACYERLVSEGNDLDDYDTLASVADMESLRRAVGVEQWNVWGVSYGTRLGLAYAREHPDRIRSLVIDSVYPPEAGGVERTKALPQGALDRLVEACAEDEACSTAIGDLGAVLDDAVAAFDAEPAELTGTVPVGGEDVERSFALTGTDVRAGMFAALYDSELIPLLPSVLAGLATGDRSIIPTFIEVGVPRLIELSEGAFYSVECADSGRLLDGADAEAELARVDEDALIALNSAQVFCQDWEVEHLPESFNEQAVPDVPTLVFGGTLDPITPYADSRAQAEAMPDARLVTVPNAGHGVGGFDECTREARTGFWADPAADLPACVEDIRGVTFTVGG